MIKPAKELNHFSGPMPTPETWANYVDEQFGSFGPFCYVDATHDMLQKLESIIAINDFDEMKSSLTELYKERYSFVDFANRNSP